MTGHYAIEAVLAAVVVIALCVFLMSGGPSVFGRVWAPAALGAVNLTDDERERAWERVRDAIAKMPGWDVGPCGYHGEAAA